MKKKKIVFDMILNIISTTIPTVVLQLLILPGISNYMTSEKYGLVVTILAVLNTVPSTIGNALNNIRLLHRLDYEHESSSGDFPIILLISELFNLVFMIIISIVYIGKTDILGIILIVIMGFLWLSREYHVVAFRLKINYTDVFYCNISLTIGYIIGFVVFMCSGYWQFIYIIGFLISYIYLYKHTHILKEKIIITSKFKKISLETIILLFSNILARIINYADKILLYPLMGGGVVSIYYAATILGKVVSLAITPINSVALTYLTKYNKKPQNIFRWTFLMGCLICVIGYIMSIILAKPLLYFLYPQFAEEAYKYVYITSATIVLSVLISMISPFILRFCSIKWQIVINGITSIFYIFISYIMLKLFGLMGFCIGALITHLLKLFISLFIYSFRSREIVMN